jgi:hypothetical protein
MLSGDTDGDDKILTDDENFLQFVSFLFTQVFNYYINNDKEYFKQLLIPFIEFNNGNKDKLEQELSLYVDEVAKDTFYLIANMACTTDDKVLDFIINTTSIPNYLDIFRKTKDVRVQKEIFYIFYAAFKYGSESLKSFIILRKAHLISIEILVQLLNTNGFLNKFADLFVSIISFLDLLIKYGMKTSNKLNHVKIELESNNIEVYIEKLMYHENIEVCDAAQTLMNAYWGDEELYYDNPNDFYN